MRQGSGSRPRAVRAVVSSARAVSGEGGNSVAVTAVPVRLFVGVGSRLEPQGCAVDTVAQACRLRTILKDVSEVAATARADDLGHSAGVGSLAEFGVESRRLFAGAFALVFVVVMASGLYYRGILTFLPNVLEPFPEFAPIPLTALLPPAVTDALGVAPDSVRSLNPERYFYSGLLIVGVVGQYVGGKLIDRVPVEYGLAGGFGLLAVLAVLFLPAASAGLVPLLVVGAVLGAALFFVQPFYQATVAEYSPPGTRGLSYGFTYLGVFGVGALGGTIAGVILTYATPAALFATLAGFAVVGSGVGIYLLRRRRRGNRAGDAGAA